MQHSGILEVVIGLAFGSKNFFTVHKFGRIRSHFVVYSIKDSLQKTALPTHDFAVLFDYYQKHQVMETIRRRLFVSENSCFLERKIKLLIS